MKYTIEFKQQIVALAVAGKPKREIAREYNIVKQQFTNGLKNMVLMTKLRNLLI